MWNPIVNVDITLNTAGTTREGFGLPLFLASTDNFEERVRGYTSLTEVAEDFDENSAAYKAAKQLWSQTPKVTQLYIGRRAMQYTVSIPDEVTESTDYSLTVAVSGGVSQPFQYTSQSEDTAEKVLQQLKTQIEAEPSVKDLVTVNVTGAGGSATMVITKAGDNDFVKVTTTAQTVSIVNLGRYYYRHHRGYRRRRTEEQHLPERYRRIRLLQLLLLLKVSCKTPIGLI